MPEPTITFPYACFTCRRSFKRAQPVAFAEQSPVLTCPGCGGKAVQLSRKFKPPKRDDLEQWRKVRDLVAAGCFFYSYANPHPEHRRDVPAFIERQKPQIDRDMNAFPDYFLAITRVAAAAVI